MARGSAALKLRAPTRGRPDCAHWAPLSRRGPEHVWVGGSGQKASTLSGWGGLGRRGKSHWRESVPRGLGTIALQAKTFPVFSGGVCPQCPRSSEGTDTPTASDRCALHALPLSSQSSSPRVPAPALCPRYPLSTRPRVQGTHPPGAALSQDQRE